MRNITITMEQGRESVKENRKMTASDEVHELITNLVKSANTDDYEANLHRLDFYINGLEQTDRAMNRSYER